MRRKKCFPLSKQSFPEIEHFHFLCAIEHDEPFGATENVRS